MEKIIKKEKKEQMNDEELLNYLLKNEEVDKEENEENNIVKIHRFKEKENKEKIVTKSKFGWVRNNNSINNKNNSNNNHNHVESLINKKKNFYFEKKNHNDEKGLKRMKTKNSYSKLIDDDLAIRLHKMIHQNDDSKLNLTQRKKNNNSNGNLDYSIKGNKR